MSQPKGRSNYHRYLGDSPESEPWGVAVTAAGRQVSPAGAPYPPAGHPDDHAFSWAKGRVLGACQIVFVTSGRGRFESRATGPREIGAGVAMVVLPGVWHRYAPDPATGWVEDWIELRGGIVDQLRQRGVLSEERAIVTVARALELAGLFQSIHARMEGDQALVFDPERSALGLQVLALTSGAGAQAASTRSMAALMGRAGRLMADTLEQAKPMPAIARELGIAYSYFRREFKRHIGLSPQRYQNQLRLEKARRLLGATDEPIKSIAERLAFSSQYHFSTAFKRQFGVSPRQWRHDHAVGPAGADGA